MNVFRKPRARRWSAFGLSALAGLTAGIVWAPAPGQHTRARLAERFRDWSHTVAGRWNLWQALPFARPRRPPTTPPRPAPASPPDLALRPERLLMAD